MDTPFGDRAFNIKHVGPSTLTVHKSGIQVKATINAFEREESAKGRAPLDLEFSTVFHIDIEQDSHLSLSVNSPDLQQLVTKAYSCDVTASYDSSHKCSSLIALLHKESGFVAKVFPIHEEFFDQPSALRNLFGLIKLGNSFESDKDYRLIVRADKGGLTLGINCKGFGGTPEYDEEQELRIEMKQNVFELLYPYDYNLNIDQALQTFLLPKSD
mmetsp:Transcript_1106/g.2034  ORF Transcript_1106/g.2034 Transcript_1106/m.2034 type:complete len:214 (+) Transcript_1106:253-894(+)